ncbi:MAG: D-alanine--D-alanine ligase family protein [Eubacteriaceae bacterium]|jgi:D-alanine-D-alanine ligase
MNKTRIGLVFGGQSGEHEVSCVSASNVYKAIDQNKYEIIPIGIKKDGTWNIYRGDVENIASGDWKTDKENLQEDVGVFTELKGDVDLFFPVLHGQMGEDGTIQGVFEMLGTPYVGCGVLASTVGMDKIMSKYAFEAADIPSCRYIPVTRYAWKHDRDVIEDKIVAELGLPVFVKPANMGSSVGISKAHSEEELFQAMDTAFSFDRRVIVESFVNAHEIETAVLEEEGKIQVAVPGEIIPAKEFYDYEAKYESGDDSVIVIPAQLDQEILDQVVDYSRKAFEAVDGTGLARVDFFVDKTTGAISINEINTMPGFTSISMYPKMWEASGIPYHELVERLIQTASLKKNPTTE